MVDAQGVAVDVGDKVAYNATGYRDIQFGYVMYTTPQGARIMPRAGEYELNRLSSYFVKLPSEVIK